MSDLPLAPLHATGRPLADEVYDVLGAAIRDGTLAPGQNLRDVDVATALGVSRTPVREALQRLERTGMVEVSASRYTRVSQPDPQALIETHEYLVYAVGIGLRMALERCTDDELAQLLVLLDDVVAASESDDAAVLTQASAALYTHVAQTSGNRVYLQVMQEAGLYFQRAVRSWPPHLTDVAERTRTYRELRTAAAARDAAGAERVVREQHGIVVPKPM